LAASSRQRHPNTSPAKGGGAAKPAFTAMIDGLEKDSFQEYCLYTLKRSQAKKLQMRLAT
jgi:hypothetical protein